MLSVTMLWADDSGVSVPCLCEVWCNMYQIQPGNGYVSNLFLGNWQFCSGWQEMMLRWQAVPGDNLSNQSMYTLKPSSKHRYLSSETWRKIQNFAAPNKYIFSSPADSDTNLETVMKTLFRDVLLWPQLFVSDGVFYIFPHFSTPAV